MICVRIKSWGNDTSELIVSETITDAIKTYCYLNQVSESTISVITSLGTVNVSSKEEAKK